MDPATVVILILMVTAVLCQRGKGMLFWPTDAFAYYRPGALRWHRSAFLSEIHEEGDQIRRFWLHGKEILIASGALVQKSIGNFKKHPMASRVPGGCESEPLVYWLGTAIEDFPRRGVCVPCADEMIWVFRTVDKEGLSRRRFDGLCVSTGTCSGCLGSGRTNVSKSSSFLAQ